MKKRLLAFSTLIALSSGVSFGQQEKLLTHFIFDKMSVNPGATGIDNGVCGTMIYRNQWDRVNGAPNSFVFNVDANLQDLQQGSRTVIPGQGIGISFYHDAIGFNRQNNAVLNYAYPIDIPNVGTLSVGVGLGIVNFGVNPLWVPPTDPVANDPNLAGGATSGTNFDMNAGLYFKGRQDYYVGLSTTHISQAELKNLNYSTRRHYFLMGGKRFNLGGNVNKAIDANVMLRTELVKFSADVNVRYIANNTFYGGLTYRTSDAVAFMAGFKALEKNDAKGALKMNLWAGYSYDLTINKLSNISTGTHELMVRGCYFIPPPPITKSKHPRWL